MALVKLPTAILFTLSAVVATSAFSDESATDLHSLGFSPERLARVSSWIDERVMADKEAGVQLLIARHGQVVFSKNAGILHGDIPISSDSIFYIHSMTKPITSAAVMMLYEEGKFHLFDPVSKYLPELAEMRVYQSGTGNNMETRPAKNQITILHLLTHTSGFVYDFLARKELADWYKNNLSNPKDLADTTQQLAKAPLAFEPGTAWEYGVSTTILARLVEVVSGEKFSDFLERRLFDPLDMRDTRYYVKKGEIGRRSTSFIRNDEGVLQQKPVNLQRSLSKPTYTPGDSGLYSTVRDYFRFSQMLLNGGVLDGARVLGPRTVDLMMTDFVPPSFPKPVLPPGRGFSPGFSVYSDYADTQSMVTPGSVTWPGAGGCLFWIDPSEKLIVILMTQTYPPNIPRMQSTLESLVYQAIID